MRRCVAEIVIDGASGSFDRRYSYSVPESLRPAARPGCRVTVPFGRGDGKRQGMILALREEESAERQLKDLYGVTDPEPVLNDEMLRLCVWMKESTFCTHFDAIRTMLPAGLNYRLTDYYAVNPEFGAQSLLSEEENEILAYLSQNGTTPRDRLEKGFQNAAVLLSGLEEKQAVLREGMPVRRMGDKTARFVRLCCETEELASKGLTPRQYEVARLVADTGGASVKEIRYFTGVTESVITALVKKGVLETFEKEVLRAPYRPGPPEKPAEIQLTAEQQAAFRGLHAQMNAGKSQVSLLYGVTGSGKTQVFLRLVDEAAAAGRGVIVMVPEIALTPQMLRIFSSRYGDQVAVFHSAMSLGRRMDEYKRIRQGRARIAVGTRSAVFAPFENLGLIIIDEEQEHTYKSEKSPRFHARELARKRADYHKCLLCLASATPSLESYSAALDGRYGLFRLSSRYGGAVLPSVTTVDMRKELLSGNTGSISRELYDAVSAALEDGKQAIVLLNRRGHNTYITCPSCGYVATCPSCSVSLTYHSANGRLMCHYCGHSEPAPKTCPQCGSEHVRFLGVGTQRVEEELRGMFPSSRVLRLDADNIMTRDAYAGYLNAFAAGEYDIMLGTQMVAKGLDFPNVTVVGVIGADRAMYSEDYRSFERTFSLLTQVVGRAGRGGSAGHAVIQTVDPDSSVISLACRQDYDAFYREEILTRQVMVFPPYCDICVICAQSSDRALAEETITAVFTRIKELLASDYQDVRVIILGPTAAAMPKINNRYRFRMTVKCKNRRRFRDMLRTACDIRLKRDAALTIDMNPETVI